MTAKKTAAKRAVKNTTQKVQTIHALDRLPDSVKGNPQFTVYFNDGTHAVTKKDSLVNNIITQAENVAPNILQVTYENGEIIDVSPVDVDKAPDEA